jgi:hypothetical protein
LGGVPIFKTYVKYIIYVKFVITLLK